MSTPRESRYLLEIGSIVVAIFKEAEGLSGEREVIEIEEGGREHALKRIGPYAKGAFFLLDGETDDRGVYDWMDKSRDDGGTFVSSRRNGCVILIDPFGEEVMRWRFRMAAVTDWDGPTAPPPPGKSYEIERMGIGHEGLEMVLRRT